MNEQNSTITIKEQLTSVMQYCKKYYITWFDNLKTSLLYLLFGIVGFISSMVILIICTTIIILISISILPWALIKRYLKK